MTTAVFSTTKIFTFILIVGLMIGIIYYFISIKKEQLSVENKKLIKIYGGLLIISFTLALIIPQVGNTDSIDQQNRNLESKLYDLNYEISERRQDIEEEKYLLESKIDDSQQTLEWIKDEIEELEHANQKLTERLENTDKDSFFNFNNESSLEELSLLIRNSGNLIVQSDHHLKTTGISHNYLGRRNEEVPWDVFHFNSTILVLKHLNNDMEIVSYNFNGDELPPITISLIDDRRQGVPNYGS